MRRTAQEGSFRSDDQTGGKASCPEPMESRSSDYLDYLSDMILELRMMAERAETPTLAGILDLAHREARQQADLRHNR